MNEEILLLRIPFELVSRIKGQKSIPLPLIEPETPKTIGLCTFDGLKLLLRITGGNSGLAYDVLEKCPNYSKAEFYRLVGVSKMAMIGSIKNCSPSYDISPAFFDDYPYFDGQTTITKSSNEVVKNWLKAMDYVPPLPEPKPRYTGRLAQALAEL